MLARWPSTEDDDIVVGAHGDSSPGHSIVRELRALRPLDEGVGGPDQYQGLMDARPRTAHPFRMEATMSTQTRSEQATPARSAAMVETKLEVVVIPVSD